MSGRVTPERTRTESVGLRVAAVSSAIFWGVLFFGVIDLMVPLEETPGFYSSYLLETGWGITYTFLVAAAFLSLAVRPDMTMPLVQVVLVGLSLAVTALASGSLVQLAPAIALVLNAFGFRSLARGRLALGRAWKQPHVDPRLAVLAALLTPPAVIFALDMVAGYREGRPPRDDDTWGIDHWPTQAAFSLAIVLVPWAVAVGVRKGWPGSGVSAVCVAVAVSWFAVMSMAYPNHAGSIGQRWGQLVLAWAVTLLLAVAWRLLARSASARGGSRGVRSPPG